MGNLVASLILIVPLTLFNGWVTMVGWNWYFPTLFGLPSIQFRTAIGFYAALYLVIPRITPKTDADEEWTDFVSRVIAVLITEMIFVFVAWLFKP